MSRKDTNLILNELIQGLTFSVRQDSNALINSVYDGTSVLNVNVSGLDTSTITDFNITGATAGDMLVYGTNSKWENSKNINVNNIIISRNISQGNSIILGTNSNCFGKSNYANGNAIHVEGVGNISYTTYYEINEMYLETKTLEVITTTDKTSEFAEGTKIYIRNYPNGGNLDITIMTVVSSSWDGTYTQVIVEEDCQDIYDNSDWEIYLADSVEFGYASHVEGERCIATGEASHAEGNSTISSNMATHAEGSNTKATGSYAHAEGGNTIASGSNAHAEGFSTRATGGISHAEGDTTIASGYASHAEGLNSRAYLMGMYAKSTGYGNGWSFQYGNITLCTTTTDDTKTELFIDGGFQYKLIIPNNTIYNFRVLGLGVDSLGNTATYKIEGTAKNIGGTVSVANVTATEITDDFTITGMNAEADDTNDALVITATGKAGTNINWSAFVEWQEITFA